MANTLLPGGAPTLATSNDETPTTSLPSAHSKRGRRTSNDDEVMVYSLNHPPMKQRVRLSLSQTNRSNTFRLSDDQRVRLTRLAESDPMSPPPANKSMGRGSGKDGRPIVSDLIQAREAEAAEALRKELAEERKRHDMVHTPDQNRSPKRISWLRR